MRDFDFLLSTNTTWYAARWIDMTVTGWLALELTGSPLFLAVIGACRTLPLLLLGVAGGVVAEHVERRKMALIAIISNVVITGTMLIAALAGVLAPWQLVVLSLLLNTVWGLNFASRRMFLADTVADRGDLTTAMALDQFSFVAANLVFSAVAGALIPIAGAVGPYALAFLLHALGWPLAVLIRKPAVHASRADKVHKPTVSYRRVIRAPVVAGVLVVSVIMNCLSFPVNQFMPLVARDLLNVGPIELGLLMSASGGGSFLASILLFTVAPRRAGLLFTLGALLGSMATFAFSFSSFYPLSIALVFASGFMNAFFGTYQSSLILEAAGAAYRAKALGALTVAIGSQPIGVLFIGGLAATAGSAFSLRLATGIAVAAVIFSAIIFRQMWAFMASSDR